MTRPWLSPAALILPLLLPLLTGCGVGASADLVGVAGVVRGPDGSPVLVVEVCHKDIDTIGVYASRQGLADDQPNPTVATWTTRRPATGLIRFSLASPPAGWVVGAATPRRVHLEPDWQYVELARRSQEDAEATQVSFRPRNLQRGQVLVANSRTWSVKWLEQHACDHDHDHDRD